MANLVNYSSAQCSSSHWTEGILSTYSTAKQISVDVKKSKNYFLSVWPNKDLLINIFWVDIPLFPAL